MAAADTGERRHEGGQGMFVLSGEERAARAAQPQTTEAMAELIRANGYVVLDSVVDLALIAEIRAAFDPLFDEYIARKGYNTGVNRARMYLPFALPYIREEIIANPVILPALEAILGEGMRCTYFASDTPAPGSDYQSAHSDVGPLFPDVSVSLPTYAMVVNIPLVDVDDENGPLEIWPGGTHMNPEWAAHVTLDGSVGPHLDIVRAASRMPSERVHMKAGSIVIRDSRVWHRGTPNRSTARRTNLALVYSRHWLGAGNTIAIPQATYDALSPAARSLFRKERIGAAVRMPWDW
jgi:ectoine hydroxylase-related dioxygenase (phytanoyl-CoA dioxygenase family)